ncbi:MAG: HWE histidine kinase domain-containing protein, partial [Pseudomonadota bacterium]
MDEAPQDHGLLKAKEECTAEPVHDPGGVQAFACLVALDPKTDKIVYASENSSEILGIPVTDLLGKEVRDLLGREVVHGLRNAQALPDFAYSTKALGTFDIGGHTVDASAFTSDGLHILELERSASIEFDGEEAFRLTQILLDQIKTHTEPQALFRDVASILKFMTGYDRVMVCQFDAEFNGTIVAEERRSKMEPYDGLRFPHWDVPAQARAIMAKLPLRIIQDVDQELTPLKSALPEAAPLDLTLAAGRGTSEEHMQYLRNMGAKATMTLSIKVDDRLWGMISFHHRRPRVPPSKMREVLISFIGVFSVKLKSLEDQAALAHINKIDTAKLDILAELETERLDQYALLRLGPLLFDAMNAAGVAMMQGSHTLSYGHVPKQAVMEKIASHAKKTPGDIVEFDSLKQAFPDIAQDLNGCAGVLALSLSPGRIFCVFRDEIVRTIKWAGKPERRWETYDGAERLAPRSSFSVYLEKIEGHCAPWSAQDLNFMTRLWPIMNAVERNRLLQKSQRSLQIMVDELNHRVRNILALVRSVSRQSRRRYGSLESYSAALESRIQALAASHEVSTGSNLASVSIAHLINRETAPFMKKEAVRVAGDDPHIRSDIAPIFSLVIHELTTNAVKYGALSMETGRVAITVSQGAEGVQVRWEESGGPPVSEPQDRGFGSALIENAVPHELNGHAELNFETSGVRALVVLPMDVIDANPATPQDIPRRADPIRIVTPQALPGQKPAGTVLLVEDNFIIAQEMVDQLSDFGFEHIFKASNSEDAIGFLEDEKPILAILDVNLGAGQTSFPIAQRLRELDVPFAFATGYGETAQIGPHMRHAPKLLKPVTTTELQDAVAILLKSHE